MIRIRLVKGLTETDLQNYGFTEVQNPGRTYWSKKIGPYEVQIKLSFPGNLRIQDWADNRAPWLLFKSLLLLEEGDVIGGKLKVHDSGYYKILEADWILELIKDLNQYTDIEHRLEYWYSEYLAGRLTI